VVERAIGYLTGSWWSSATLATEAEAQLDLDRWTLSKADSRRRGSQTVGSLADTEPLLTLPARAFPAMLEVERTVDRQAMVAFEGNRYSTGPEAVGQKVRLTARLGELAVEIHSASGALLARHRRAPTGAGQRVRLSDHSRALEQEVLAQFQAEGPRRKRKRNHPPGEAARAEARRLGRDPGADRVLVDLTGYAQVAEVAR
jgi:hypothetical protein